MSDRKIIKFYLVTTFVLFIIAVTALVGGKIFRHESLSTLICWEGIANICAIFMYIALVPAPTITFVFVNAHEQKEM